MAGFIHFGNRSIHGEGMKMGLLSSATFPGRRCSEEVPVKRAKAVDQREQGENHENTSQSLILTAVIAGLMLPAAAQTTPATAPATITSARKTSRIASPMA